MKGMYKNNVSWFCEVKAEHNGENCRHKLLLADTYMLSYSPLAEHVLIVLFLQYPIYKSSSI